MTWLLLALVACFFGLWARGLFVNDDLRRKLNETEIAWERSNAARDRNAENWERCKGEANAARSQLVDIRNQISQFMKD